jgi:hypothetical protein
MTPGRGAPPFLIPQANLFTMRVSFTPADLEAARQSMLCQKTQYPQADVERVIAAMRDTYEGELLLSPMVPQAPATDLFR